ncbi:MAG TPA: 4-hydroxythreonine-4-phosphate dehydrogenase PdxA [Polyangia bacterium]|nr:4-hydroxythreonine-4-phosphate dehydrogenase PdxA [Polyangia bacterium]
MRIGVTLGDPSGIGPEIIAAALAAGGGADVIVYGDRRILDEAAAKLGVAPPTSINEVTKLGAWTPGRPSASSGRAQLEYLEAAVADARAGKLDALVTAPIHKASAIAAGFAFPGHTEFLQERFAVERVTMMFAGPRLKVSLATIHLALADVPRALDVASLAGTIVQTARALAHDFAIAAPRVAVAALNPHAGESGHFGDEESRVLIPAIERARAELAGALPGAAITGPHVPDAVFRDALADAAGGARHDAVVAMYHDQGLIPVKLADFEEAVNVTLGLPIVRTSPDHGVAHDLAGQGRARSTSFAAALRLARQIVAHRARKK